MTDEEEKRSDGVYEEILEKCGVLICPIRGVSMLPMLEEEKDKVKIVPVARKQGLKKYDLPLYRRENGQYVLHRIIGVRRDGYVICGDNLWRKEKVPFDWILGVAEGFFKDGKYISCQDEKYRSYVKKRCAGRLVRKWKNIAGRIVRKLKTIGRKNS